MRLRIVLYLAAAATLFCAFPASAQSAVQSEEQNRLELSRRYYEALNLDATVRAMLDGMLPAIMANSPNAALLSERQRKAIGEASREATLSILPQLKEATIKMTAESFSTEELAALVDFYESPLGKSIVAKTPAYSARSGELMRDLLPTITAKIPRLICAHEDLKAACRSGDAPAASSASQ